MDICKAADVVAQTVCEELSTKTLSVSFMNLEKEQCFPDVKQVKDSVQKLTILSSCVRSQ